MNSAELRENHKPPAGSKPVSWAAELADEINNRWQLGLSDGDARQLANLIYRRAVKNLSE